MDKIVKNFNFTFEMEDEVALRRIREMGRSISQESLVRLDSVSESDLFSRRDEENAFFLLFLSVK